MLGGQRIALLRRQRRPSRRELRCSRRSRSSMQCRPRSCRPRRSQPREPLLTRPAPSTSFHCTSTLEPSGGVSVAAGCAHWLQLLALNSGEATQQR